MLKVLVVEDEDVIRNGLVFTLNWADMRCDVIGSARDGAEGLQMIRLLSPDIVLTDIKMPHMDGLNMIKEASKDCLFKAIILTSYSEFEYAKRAIGLRVSDYLLKPVDERELWDVVSRIGKEIDKPYNHSEGDKKAKPSELSELEHSDMLQSLHTTQNVYVKKAVEKIIEEYREKISIDTVAEELGVSGSYLSRKFKESFGKSYLDVLNQYRIQQSIRLLKKGTYRVYEVSCMCGFNEYKHFCSVFKKYTNMRPSQFINSCNHADIQSTDDE